jgi:class 3 adenylate cyclase
LTENIQISRRALESERKQVTVLFADLKGSMELLADRDPEEARQLLDPVLTLMMDAVHRCEGTVNQVMGDGIMALFGAPIAHEDHAVRACYAALAMQEAVARYAEEPRRHRGLEVQIRIGLNSGEVVVRSIGSDLHMDYTAVGQTTHLAGRMEQLARPGTILLTAGTWGLIEGYFEVKPVGAVPVKGLTTAVQTYGAGTGAYGAICRHRAVSRHGHDALAIPGGGGAGSDGMTPHHDSDLRYQARRGSEAFASGGLGRGTERRSDETEKERVHEASTCALDDACRARGGLGRNGGSGG